jgi:lipase chaperone LimK
LFSESATHNETGKKLIRYITTKLPSDLSASLSKASSDLAMVDTSSLKAVMVGVRDFFKIFLASVNDLQQSHREKSEALSVSSLKVTNLQKKVEVS